MKTTKPFRFLDLPEIIFLLLKTYLSHREYRDLINTCKNYVYFQELKKHECCYDLSPEYTEKYISDVDFRQHILSLLKKPNQQLGLNLRNNKDQIDLTLLNNVSSVMEFHDIYECLSSDLTVFHSVMHLQLSNVNNVTILNGLEFLVDLNLHNFPKLTDISPLEHCHSLKNVRLSRCNQLFDINALASVSKVQIDSCPISDDGIKSLTFVRFLELRRVVHLNYLNHLLFLESLKLEGCPRVMSISGLSDLSTLTIDYCPNFTHYFDLPSLRKLKCTRSYGVKVNVSNSLQIQEMTLDNVLYSLNVVENLYLFKSLSALSVSSLPGTKINELAQLPLLRKLELGFCTECDIHLFQQITWLSIRLSNEFSGIYLPMPNLQSLRLFGCSKLETLIGIESNRNNMNIRIESCWPIPNNCYQILLGTAITAVYKPRNPLNIPIIEEMITTTTFPSKRNKIFQFSEGVPFQGPALNSIFANLLMLSLTWFTEIESLEPFLHADIHLIPVLQIVGGGIRFLYPPGIIPQHERVLLSECNELIDISSIARVPRVSIHWCEKLMDIRPLQQCPWIEYTKASYHSIPLGYEELKGRIGQYTEIVEVGKLQRIFSE